MDKKFWKAYFYNLMSAVSRTFNALGGNDPRETMSSHIGKKMRDGKPLTIAEKVYKFIVNPLIGEAHWVASIDESVGDQGAWHRRNDTFV